MPRHEWVVRYTVLPCAFGHILAAATEHGFCAATLGDDPALLIAELACAFSDAALDQNGGLPDTWKHALLDYLNGEQRNLDLPLDVVATPFQQEVWNALCAIPYGTTQTYQQVAQRIGRPYATRAVARACASNPTALIIPCHRVVRADGALGGYRWGIERKRALIAHEIAHVELCAS